MSLRLVTSPWKVFDVILASSPNVGDVATGDPDRVPGATGPHGQVLELWIHHGTLLRSANGRLDAIDRKRWRDVDVRHVDSQRKGVAVGQVVGISLGTIVDDIRFDAGSNHQSDDLAEVQAPLTRSRCSFADQCFATDVHVDSQSLDGLRAEPATSGDRNFLEPVMRHQAFEGLNQRSSLGPAEVTKEEVVILVGKGSKLRHKHPALRRQGEHLFP